MNTQTVTIPVPANLAYQGQHFSAYECDFAPERAADLARLAVEYAARNRNGLAAQMEAKADYIGLTLAFLSGYAGQTFEEHQAALAATPTPDGLAAFRAGCTIMTVESFANEYGADILEGIEGVDSVLVYEGGTWIANMGTAFNRTHYLILERDEHTTADGHLTLRDLEELLYQWTLDQKADPFDAPETSANPPRWNAPIGTADDDTPLHALARAMMATRTDLPLLSLDEWLAEHHDRLTAKERAAARAILALF